MVTRRWFGYVRKTGELEDPHTPGREIKSRRFLWLWTTESDWVKSRRMEPLSELMGDPGFRYLVFLSCRRESSIWHVPVVIWYMLFNSDFRAEPYFCGFLAE